MDDMLYFNSIECDLIFFKNDRGIDVKTYPWVMTYDIKNNCHKNDLYCSIIYLLGDI